MPSAGLGASDGAEALAGLLALLPCCIVFPLMLLVFAFWIWMLVDVLRKDFPGENEKVIWVLVVVLLSWIGALVYFFVGRQKGQLPQR